MKAVTKITYGEIVDLRFLRYTYSFFSVLDAGLLTLITVLLISSLLPKILLLPLTTGCMTVVLYSLILGIVAAKKAGLPSKIAIQIFIKRLVDIIMSGVGLLVLAPIMLVIMVIIKIESPGPILFKQKRVGLGRKEFAFLKFRTMIRGAEIEDGSTELQNKRRWITRSGRVLRKFAFDEFPQLINVFKGDMSIVGPRPVLSYETEYFDSKRFNFLPGITCLWQVKGRNDLTFNDWVKLDMEYVTNWSILLDIKIVLQTIPAALFGHY
ncbi:MAG: sugar transferase [Candidatus Atribacteria bacterium]|nr:sugar transferase [Candidatus Atribacteria bacterium]